MTTIKKSGIAKLALAVGTAASLAFGATQALAAPAAGAVEKRACTNQYCRDVACYPF